MLKIFKTFFAINIEDILRQRVDAWFGSSNIVYSISVNSAVVSEVPIATRFASSK